MTQPITGLAPANPINVPAVASIDVSVQPSTAGVAGADLKKRANPHLYHFTKKVSWKGESYLLSIDFPCKDWKNLNADELKHAADEYADIFIADLQEQLDNQTSPEEEQIKPGDDIAIHFQGEKGYVVYTQSGIDTHTDLSSKKKQLQAMRETSRALSKIINDNVGMTEEYAAFLHQQLQSDILKNLREKAIANKPVNVEPIQLKHQENNCFLNAPFQLLVNDPVLRDALRDPDTYKEGDKDALYQAIRAYDRHKSKSTPFEVPDLGIVTGGHEDAVLDALDALTKDHFKEDSIPSFLPDPVNFEGGKTLSLETIAKEQNKELPNAFNIYVTRATDTGKVKDKVAVNDKGTLSLTKEGTTKAYELTSFMVHKGDDIHSGHYVTYLRQGDQCWELDDLQSKTRSIPLKTFLEKAADGSYFRFCEEKTTKTMSASTSPVKEPNTVLVTLNRKTSHNYEISIEEGSMANAENYLLVHPTTENLARLHPQFKDICPNLSQDIKTTNSWRNLWGVIEPSYLPAGVCNADIAQGTSSNLIHVPLKSNAKVNPFAPLHPPIDMQDPSWEQRTDVGLLNNLIHRWIFDTLDYAQKHSTTQLAFPIPYSAEEVHNTAVFQEQLMKGAIHNYMEANPNAFRGGLQVKIIYPKEWNVATLRTSEIERIQESPEPAGVLHKLFRYLIRFISAEPAPSQPVDAFRTSPSVASFRTAEEE